MALHTQSTSVSIPVVYGKIRIGGNIVDCHTSGSDNEYLHIIMTLSEGPIEGIETIYFDDKPSNDFGSLVYYELYNGDGNQELCTTYRAAKASWNDYMRYTAYLYIRLDKK